MRVKKYLVDNMPEAMALIRTELGYDAVILHSQKVKRGGLTGLFRQPKFEVIAAVDNDLRDFPQPTPAVDTTVQAMQRELAALKTALAQVTETPPRKELPRIASLDGWYQRLLDQGITAPLARQIVQTVSDELSRWALDNQKVLNEHLHWYLGRQLPPTVPLTLSPGKPRVFFLVGPTGVGKTTTMAKLAANFASSSAQGARVMMITADTFRVAAIPQISAFGEILGVPVEVAYTPDQLASLVKNNQHQDLILIDTPGRSMRAANEVAALGDYLAAIPNKTVHLALTAGAKYEDMRHTVDAFGKMSLNGLIFTKVDETGSLGAAYSLACDTGLPLSYLTTGQRVPEDIEVATAERLVDLMVGTVPDKLRSTRKPYPVSNLERLG
ncbi:MAG: hypothetical protein AB1801_02095 [Chloroflexota bacterium]